MVSGSDRGLDFIAKHNIKGMILGTHVGFVDHWVRNFQTAYNRTGKHVEPGENLGLGLWAYVDDTQEKAKKALKPLFEEHVNSRPRWACCATPTIR